MTPNSSTDSATRDGLLPCPFCGDPKPTFSDMGDMDRAFVMCGNCGADVDTLNCDGDAREVWNRRADTLLAASRAEVERLREALRQIAEVVPGGWHKDDGTHVANSFIHSARAALSTKKD